MKLRNTILTGAASYIQMGVVIITQLAAIPLALRYLDTERFGLWSFVNQSLGYLLLLDFGVASSIGRLMVEPLHTGDNQTRNGWFNMILAILSLQGLLALGVGLGSADAILHWFNLPPALLPEARQLWLSILFLYSVAFPFRLISGILSAQNRYYCYLAANCAGLIVWFIAFFFFLHIGFGTFSYFLSTALQMLVSTGIQVWSLANGPHRFRISFRNIPWCHARELFSFSSAVFVCAIAIQVVFMSQSLIITKVLGLGAVTAFTVCSKVPMQLMQLVWRPFDAFNSRWQIFWANAEVEPLATEFVRMLRLTIGLALLAATCSVAMNRWFVLVFGKAVLYQGKAFDAFFAIFLIAQVWTHCLAFSFPLTKKMKGFMYFQLVDTALGIVVAIVGTKMFGLVGYIAFTSVYTAVGVMFWYITLKGPRFIGQSSLRLVRESAMPLLLFGMLILGSLPIFKEAALYGQGVLLGTEIAVVIVGVLLFAALFRRELQSAIARVGQILAKHRVQKNQPAPIS